jgi:type IV pilus assembly protein PilC
MTADPIAAFAFKAQSLAGDVVTGTINADSLATASQQLHALQLRAIELDPLRTEPARAKPLTGDDFAAFNMQLAHLATAGLPIEKSLRLIAQDTESGALASSINDVASDLEAGRSLPEAFARHSAQFPPLYSEVVNAGIRSGNLSGMLLGLGRHLDLIKRLRGMLWRAAAYPIMVMLSLLVVIGFLGIVVLPKFKEIFQDFRVELPAITVLVIGISDFLVDDWPVLLGLLLVIFLGIPFLLRSQPAMTRQRVVEFFILPLPIIGRALRRNLLARWCDALKLGVEAGMDLPAAISMAGQAIGSPALMRDGAMLVEALRAGQPLTSNIRTRLIPPTVTTVLALAAKNSDLPSGLGTLSAMFQQLAELQLATIPTVLTPILIMFIACVIGLVVLAMFAPMIALIQSVSGPMH